MSLAVGHYSVKENEPLSIFVCEGTLDLNADQIVTWWILLQFFVSLDVG